MPIFSAMPHASIPAGALNVVGDPLPSQVTPESLEIVGNARQAAINNNTSKMISGRQVFVGIVMRVDNDYISGTPDAPFKTSPVQGLPLPAPPKTLKIRVFIPEIHAAFGRLNVSWPESEVDHFLINEFTQVVGSMASLGGRKPLVGDCILTSIQNISTLNVLEAGNVLGYAYDGKNSGDIINVGIFQNCTQASRAQANNNANEGRSLPSNNRARSVNEENPNRVGNVESNPQQQEQQQQQQQSNNTNDTPGATIGTPKCGKVYSMAGVDKNEEAHTNLANMPASSRRTVQAWAWGSFIKNITVVKKYGKWFTPELLAAFEKMRAAAARDNIKIKPNSVYRSPQKQQQLRRRFVMPDRRIDLTDQITKKRYSSFNEFADKAVGKPPNFDRPVGRPGAGSPGHQAGLAIDLSTGIGNTRRRLKTRDRYPVYKWLVDNAHKYGFVRNVPTERWHFAWTGKPATKPTVRIAASHWSWDDTLEGTQWEYKGRR